MILHVGERVFWGAPEVIYLEGPIITLNAKTQTVVVHIERATPHSAHLINSELPFAADGVTPLQGDSPPGTTTEFNAQRQPPPVLSEDEKIHRAAAAAIHQQFGYNLPAEQEQQMTEQVAQALARDTQAKSRILTSMDEILKREW
ncbi:MAG TPA: hypothetical protein VL461_14650 [Dictyobacter sp.]|jgi:hypothetical protein|nr:hypothetical protein [Dictyobacter sp.]